MKRRSINDPGAAVRIFCTFLGLIAFLASCKKTDHFAQTVNGEPYIVTGEVSLYGSGLGYYPGYKTAYLVGDTATFVGKFFLNSPGSRIQIGNDTPHILSYVQAVNSTDSVNQYTKQPDKWDVIRFLITQNMGIGSKIPVSITAGGVTIQAPSISIRQFQGIVRKTDTTLWVDSLTTWLPPDINYYNNALLPYIDNAFSISGDGVIGFSNLTGVYLLQNQQVSQLLATGRTLQENGTSYTLNLILGSVLSFAGDTMTFSAEVKENTPDTATNYIFRLCKMNLASGTVTTINRTEVQKGTPTQNEFPVVFEGAIGSLHVVAVNLKTDANGSVYFLNQYPPANTSHDNDMWYGGAYGGGLRAGQFESGDVYVSNNICRINSAGTLKSLFCQKAPADPYYNPQYAVPGYPVAMTSDWLVSLDGTTGYALDNENANFQYSLGFFDLTADAPLMSTGFYPSGYRFFSYDTSSVTGPGGATGFAPFIQAYYDGQNNYLNNFMILSDGDLLCESGGGFSMAAVNIQSQSAYCYAGSEAGLFNQPDWQDKHTGPAKYVEFFFGYPLFGTDKLNNIYFTNGAQAAGLTFYKLYAKH